jgi:hypothetical protein
MNTWFVARQTADRRLGHRLAGQALRCAIGCLFVGLLSAQPAELLFADSFLSSSQQTISRTPHPAVVRILSLEKSGTSYGSGTLVARKDAYGIVVTNWHVVRDVDGEILVTFPTGFRSTAKVLRADPTWDLAALLVWSPEDVEPIRFASRLPRPGEPLAIAGYGSGSFRAVAGSCKQYVAPGVNLPSEMIELTAVARQGDSGGPILNKAGELAGVLFGAGWRSTSGSHSGRVQAFLKPVLAQFNSQPAQLAERSKLPSYRWKKTDFPQPVQGETSTTRLVKPADKDLTNAAAETHDAEPVQGVLFTGSELADARPLVPPAPSSPLPVTPQDQLTGPPMSSPAGTSASNENDQRPAASQEDRVEAKEGAIVQQTIHWKDLFGYSWPQQLKSLLAAIGALTILVQLARK